MALSANVKLRERMSPGDFAYVVAGGDTGGALPIGTLAGIDGALTYVRLTGSN